MWDYSRLYDGGPGGAFGDLEQCVAGAGERGYNTLRVDVFVAQQLEKETRFEQNWKGGLPRWGMTRSAFSCSVRERAAELARLCRKHGVWLGLDSWKTMPDSAAATAEKLDGVLAAFGSSGSARCGRCARTASWSGPCGSRRSTRCRGTTPECRRFRR